MFDLRVSVLSMHLAGSEKEMQLRSSRQRNQQGLGGYNISLHTAPLKPSKQMSTCDMNPKQAHHRDP